MSAKTNRETSWTGFVETTVFIHCSAVISPGVCHLYDSGLFKSRRISVAGTSPGTWVDSGMGIFLSFGIHAAERVSPTAGGYAMMIALPVPSCAAFAAPSQVDAR